VRKWRHRTTVHDASHTAHRLQTTLNAAQEELVIYLRTQLLLPLDDLLAVVREFIEPTMSRSALDRLLRRRGHSRLPVPPKPDSEHKPFKAYEPGYVHVDVKYLTPGRCRWLAAMPSGWQAYWSRSCAEQSAWQLLGRGLAFTHAQHAIIEALNTLHLARAGALPQHLQRLPEQAHYVALSARRTGRSFSREVKARKHRPRHYAGRSLLYAAGGLFTLGLPGSDKFTHKPCQAVIRDDSSAVSVVTRPRRRANRPWTAIHSA